MSANAWAGILRDGEVVLWQGKPDPGFHIQRGRRLIFGVGMVFALFGLIFLAGALAGGEPEGALFAVPFAGIGLYFALSQSWWPNRKRRHTFYSLTNQRAILGIALPGRPPELKTYEIEPDRDYELRRGTPGSVIFAMEDEGIEVNGATRYFAAGFLRIAEAEKVAALIREVQQEMRDRRAGPVRASAGRQRGSA